MKTTLKLVTSTPAREPAIVRLARKLADTLVRDAELHEEAARWALAHDDAAANAVGGWN
jgi:hypothetical protein